MNIGKNRFTPKRIMDFLINNSLFIAIAVLTIITAVLKPMFLMRAPLNLIYRASAYMSMALGVGCIMLIGAGTDLSAGRVMGLVSLIAATILKNTSASDYLFTRTEPIPVYVGFLVAIILGALIGVFNGFFVGKFKLPAFIVTLSTQLMLYGTMLIVLGFAYTPGGISNLTEKYKSVITNFTVTDWLDLPFSIPNYVWYAIILVVLMWIVWNYTPLGKNMRLIGSNQEAAKALNVNVFVTTVIVFAMAGALYGLNGFVEAARVGGPGASAGANAEIEAIIACLFGGVSIKGGIGKVGGIVVGVILLQLVSVCLQWWEVSANYVYIIKGGVLILAVTMDMMKHRS